MTGRHSVRGRCSTPPSNAVHKGSLERLLRRVGIGDAAEIPLAYRLGPVRTAELANSARPAIRREPAECRPRHRRGRRLRLRSCTGNGRRPRRPTAGSEDASGRARRAAPRQDPRVGVEGARLRSAGDRLLDGPRRCGIAIDGDAVGGDARRLVTTRRSPGRPAGRLDAGRLRAQLLPRLGRFERPPADARFVIDGTRVHVARLRSRA